MQMRASRSDWSVADHAVRRFAVSIRHINAKRCFFCCHEARAVAGDNLDLQGLVQLYDTGWVSGKLFQRSGLIEGCLIMSLIA